ncbi:F-box protein At5g49610-like [Triticum urartu]|uniref:F-box protein At5g49610-like n=1 Tax=Triticum urartu TaxID=4572 RepID=UPI00204497F3|nr:F-box protein At5g49610-like [Triticum urartu]
MEEEKSADELSPDRSLVAAAVSRLTDDLIVEILSRLPFRSVCRFKCVSKPWRDLIAHPAHRKKLPQTLAGVLYTTIPDAGGFRHHLAGAYAEGLDLDTSLTFLPHTEYRYFGLEHACNGLLLCSYYPDAGSQVRFVVCNPATRRWAELPPGPQPRPNTCGFHCQFHLAFDPAVSSHFHVFDFERTDDVGLTGVSIYSSRTGAWTRRDTGLVDNVVLEHHSVLLHGMLHVVGNRRRTNSNNTWEDTTVLVAVDMEGKVWKTISMPRGQFYYRVGWSQGCLHYATISPVPLTASNDDDEDSLKMAEEVAIWRLEDYDTQQWALKHSFRIDEVLNLAEVEYQLVGFHPDRDIFFFVSMGLFDGDARDAASLLSWDMRRHQLSSVLDLEKCSVGPYRPYVPLFSSEPLADADGH